MADRAGVSRVLLIPQPKMLRVLPQMLRVLLQNVNGFAPNVKGFEPIVKGVALNVKDFVPNVKGFARDFKGFAPKGLGVYLLNRKVSIWGGIFIYLGVGGGVGNIFN